MEILKNIVLYIVLAKFDNEQSDLIHRLAFVCSLDKILDYFLLQNPVRKGSRRYSSLQKHFGEIYHQ